jgi:hypothetical protein
LAASAGVLPASIMRPARSFVQFRHATINVPSREEVSATNQAIFDKLKSSLGSVPNLYATFAHSDTALESYLAIQNARHYCGYRRQDGNQLPARDHPSAGRLPGRAETAWLSVFLTMGAGKAMTATSALPRASK